MLLILVHYDSPSQMSRLWNSPKTSVLRWMYMNKKALWITLIALITIGILAYKGGLPARTDTPHSPEAISTTFYDQTTGEALPATFEGDQVTFTSTKLGTMTLPHALSADGARYANADESIVFWNKGNAVFVTQNGTIVFNGSEGAPTTTPSGKLPAGSPIPSDPKALIGTWEWQKTLKADGTTVLPKKSGIFMLTFAADGNVSGKTDCNGFGGTYKLGSDGVLTFGPFMSTLMYCEGSQENEYNTTLAGASRSTIDGNGNLVITVDKGAGSVIFAKK